MWLKSKINQSLRKHLNNLCSNYFKASCIGNFSLINDYLKPKINFSSLIFNFPIFFFHMSIVVFFKNSSKDTSF